MLILQKFHSLMRNCTHMVVFARTFRHDAYMSRSEQEGWESPPDSRKKIIIEPMAHRELLRVHGDEIVPFLQGLITNDMNLLQSGHQASMYTMFLNKSGRVLYDTIIYRTEKPTTYLIECDKVISNDFRRLLRMYRVRRNIQIDSVDGEYRSWFAFPENSSDEEEGIKFDKRNDNNQNVFATPDPRLRQLGNRLITPSDKSFKDIIKSLTQYGQFSQATEVRNYKNLRYSYGIAEGVNELPPGKCLPLELNADFLRGVSFHKGCYIGQELTARVQHTGVVRKRLMPLRLTAPIRETELKVQTQAGAAVGSIRGFNHDRAIALLRVEPALRAAHLVIDGEPCFPEKPKWWPQILPDRGTMVN